jgi:hypothetical protein
MGEAIERTSRLYPGLLESNQNLLFMLKCRQFVEMVNGSDVEICHRKSGYSPSYSVSPRPSSPIQTSVIQSTKSYSNKSKQSVEEMNQNNTTPTHNGNSCSDVPVILTDDGDVEMDTTEEFRNGHGDSCNGKSNNSTNGYQNGNSHSNNVTQDDNCCDNEDEDMGKSSSCMKTTSNYRRTVDNR